MNKENFDYRKSAFSPIDNYYWIEQGVFEYLQKESVYKGEELDKLKVHYKMIFDSAFKKTEHLISNELDKGNVCFVLIAVSLYETFLEQGIHTDEAILLTDSCINKPLRAYLVNGTRKLFDQAVNPFQTIVQASKEREEHYFGNSFKFERPVDNEYGYILNITKCLFHETLKVLNRKELQHILCRMDLGWINGIDPEKHLMQFVRPVTYATGNTCQMWFIKKERELIKD
jgi:hypothetical protein